MTSRTTIATTLALLLTAAIPVASAGNGQGSGTGTGPIHDFSSAPCADISGIVQEAGVANSGYLIDTADTPVTIFGIGPATYWESLGLSLPQVGEPLAAHVCSLSFSDGTTKTIAISVTIGETTVTLRDEVTGQPAWRTVQGGGNRR